MIQVQSDGRCRSLRTVVVIRTLLSDMKYIYRLSSFPGLPDKGEKCLMLQNER